MKQFSPINTAVNCLRDTFVSSLIIFSYTADYIIKQLLTQQRASHIKVSVTVAQAQRIQFDIQYSEHAAKLPNYPAVWYYVTTTQECPGWKKGRTGGWYNNSWYILCGEQMIVFIMCEKAQFVYAEAHLFKMSFLYWHRRKRNEAIHLSLITTLSLEVSDFYSLIRSDYNSAFPLFCERKLQKGWSECRCHSLLGQ